VAQEACQAFEEEAPEDERKIQVKRVLEWGAGSGGCGVAGGGDVMGGAADCCCWRRGRRRGHSLRRTVDDGSLAR